LNRLQDNVEKVNIMQSISKIENEKSDIKELWRSNLKAIEIYKVYQNYVMWKWQIISVVSVVTNHGVVESFQNKIEFWGNSCHDNTKKINLATG
jgi:hypothetical protein